MAARATSSGTISFGLVSIPIKVYPAASSKSVHFNMLDGETHSRVKQQYINAKGDVVARGDMVKGYEYSRDQYVIFTEDELKALEAKSDRSVEIAEFVPMQRVDALYFGSSQLLGPDKGGAKAYRLLNEAMTTMGQVAIGRWNTRGKQQLVLIRPRGRGLVLHILHYADEVRSFDDIEFGDDVKLGAREVELATQLIEQLTSESFEPEKYEDGYRQVVLEAVDRKVAGEDVVAAPKAKEQDQIIDLMAALKKSLEERKGAGPVKVKKAASKPRRKKAASE